MLSYIRKHKVNNYDGEPVSVATRKIDGHFLELRKLDSRISTITKSGIDIWLKLSKIPHIYSQVTQIPDNSIIRCELFSFQHNATSIPTLITQQSEYLQISPFKIAYLEGKLHIDPLTNATYNRLVKIFPHTEEPIGISDSDKPLKDEYEWLDKAEELNIEGWVFYNKYGKAYKLKVEQTADVVITNYSISRQSKKLKSIEVSLYDGGSLVCIGKVGNCLPDMSLAELSKIKGRVAEVTYQSITTHNKLRAACFCRFRDGEKSPQECTIDQIKLH